MNINKNLRNVYIEGSKENIKELLPIAKAFPRSNSTSYTVTHPESSWTNHFNGGNEARFYIDAEGALFYDPYDRNKDSKRSEYKELKNPKDLLMTIQERVKQIKI